MLSPRRRQGSPFRGRTFFGEALPELADACQRPPSAARLTHDRLGGAAGGHFGRTEKSFTWEKTDKVKALKATGVPVNPEIAAGALIPLVLWAVWRTTRRIHDKIHAP